MQFTVAIYVLSVDKIFIGWLVELPDSFLQARSISI